MWVIRTDQDQNIMHRNVIPVQGSWMCGAQVAPAQVSARSAPLCGFEVSSRSSGTSTWLSEGVEYEAAVHPVWKVLRRVWP